MDTAALLRCRPTGSDWAALRDAFTRCAHERTQGAARLASLLEQRRRIVLTGTPAEMVDCAIAVQHARDTNELLDVAFGALTERGQQIAAGT